MEANTNARDFPPRAPSRDFRSILRQRAQSVAKFPLFLDIPLEDCEKIVGIAQERNFNRGKTIFFQGDSIQQVLLLTSGSVKLSQFSTDGQEVIVRLVGRGDLVNAEGHAKCATVCSTAQATERSTALAWEARHFETAAERFPILRRNISSNIQRVMHQLEERYREVCTQKVALRLSNQLLRLLESVGKESGGHVEIALSQRDLAQLIGTTLFTVSRLLCQWELRGIVKPRRESVLVLDVQALVELAGTE